MLGDLINNTSMPTLERLIAFTEQRHDLLVNNIANIDTPGYKVKDLDVRKFQQDMSEAIKNRSTQQNTGSAQQAKIDFNQYVLFHDGNNRSIEKQMTAITKNSVMHNAAVELLKSRYQLLERAISLRV